jgi:hypothetical protein
MAAKKRLEKDKKLLTMLITFFPSIILVALSNIPDPLYRAVLQVLVAFYQMVIIKNLIEDYYGGAD